MSSGQDLTRRPRFNEEQSQSGGTDRRLACPKKRYRAPISGGRDCVDTICAHDCSSTTSCRLRLLGPQTPHHHHHRSIDSFPIRLVFPIITLPFQEYWSSVFLRSDALPDENHMRGIQYQIVLNIIFWPEIN